MNIEKMREEFEAAFRQGFGFGRLTAGANADAANMLKAAEWAWQASRAAVIVELPARWSPEGDEFLMSQYDPEEARMEAYNGALDDCRKAIEASGLKVSP